MYLGKREIYNPESNEKHRQECIKYKAGAVWNTFVELEGLINKTQLAEQDFKKSLAWLSQKITGCIVYHKKKKFTDAEYHQLAEAIRYIARRVDAHAAEIAAAATETDN